MKFVPNTFTWVKKLSNNKRAPLQTISYLRNVSTTPSVSNSSTVERKTVTLIPGDGCGPELVGSVKHTFKALGVPVDWETEHVTDIGNYTGETDIEHVLESIKRNKVALMGVLTSPSSISKVDEASANINIRNGLGLFANLVRCKNIDGLKTRHDDIDMVIVREITEGEYSCLEHETVPGVIEALKVVTRRKSEKLARFAFDYALKANRQKVTCVHKANIQKLGDGLFLESCLEVAKLYPKIQFESMIVDNACMQLVSRPQQFDVLVLPNLYGGIVNNIGAGLVGGAGVVAGRTVGTDHAVFSLGTRHTFAQMAGKNVANPVAMLLTSCNLLDHIHLRHYAKMIRKAIFRTIKEGKYLTMDIGGSASSSLFTNRVIQNAQLALMQN